MGGDFDHYPTFLEMEKSRGKPPNPLKFNTTWLEEEYFIILVKEKWVLFDGTL
jgi:hypothetical protein